MMERRCFVQLIHPGGEHEPDHGTMKLWNRGHHARKFLKAPGRFGTLPYTADQEDEIVFWGEWEPETRVVARYAVPVAGGPRYLYEPFYRRLGRCTSNRFGKSSQPVSNCHSRMASSPDGGLISTGPNRAWSPALVSSHLNNTERAGLTPVSNGSVP